MNARTEYQIAYRNLRMFFKILDTDYSNDGTNRAYRFYNRMKYDSPVEVFIAASHSLHAKRNDDYAVEFKAKTGQDYYKWSMQYKKRALKPIDHDAIPF